MAITEPELLRIPVKGSGKESASRAAADAAQRRREYLKKGGVILTPSDVTGDYDIARLLTTTLGGGIERTLTHDDLALFRRNAKRVQKRYREGITAKQIIDNSRLIDRDRATKQIRTATPVHARAGVVRIITNAGPDSVDTHHYCHIHLLGYSAALTAPESAQKITEWLLKQPMKIECDCGRWRFWYRYIATIGGYNAGRDETGFPKIRNPDLAGVACKHLIRVAAELQRGAAIRLFIERMIKAARSEDKNRQILQVKQAEADAIERQQLIDGPADVRAGALTQVGDFMARQRTALSDALARASRPKRRAAATARASKNGSDRSAWSRIFGLFSR